MPSAATYKVVGVRASDLKTVVTRFEGAPGDSAIAARFRGTTDKRRHADMATRYFPSKKGWIIFDLRKAFVEGNPDRPGQRWWSGISRLPRVYPSEDAAVMVMMHKLNLPVQENLDL